jgi:heme/copper-type cytochrome/quinol oxidase subunit 2
MRFPAALLVALVLVWQSPARAQDAAPATRTFTVTTRDGRFEPERLDVTKNDLVKITLTSGDAAVSFAIDAYRLMKRAGAGESITFAFRADQVGRFAYYCSLASNEQCRTMKGTLVVAER